MAGMLLLLGCGGKQGDPVATQKATNQPASSGNPLTAPVDYLGAVAQAKKFSEKTINLAAINNAIQQFNAMEERLPKNLNELVEKHYLAVLPSSPPGMSIAYNPRSGEVRVVPAK